MQPDPHAYALVLKKKTAVIFRQKPVVPHLLRQLFRNVWPRKWSRSHWQDNLLRPCFLYTRLEIAPLLLSLFERTFQFRAASRISTSVY